MTVMFLSRDASRRGSYGPAVLAIRPKRMATGPTVVTSAACLGIVAHPRVSKDPLLDEGVGATWVPEAMLVGRNQTNDIAARRKRMSRVPWNFGAAR